MKLISQHMKKESKEKEKVATNFRTQNKESDYGYQK